LNSIFKFHCNKEIALLLQTLLSASFFVLLLIYNKIITQADRFWYYQ